jgi:hypothetical protein
MQRGISRDTAPPTRRNAGISRKSMAGNSSKLRAIENKYIFEVDCVFKGKTEFPNYLEEKEEE